MVNVLVIAALVGVSVGLPLYYAWRLWRLDAPTKAGWLLVAGEAVLVVLLILLVGRWDIAGSYTRLVLAGLFAAAAAVSVWRHAGRPWRDGGAPAGRGHVGRLVSLVLLAAALAYVAAGLVPARETHALAFPLEGGRFMVGQGGGNFILNHHAGHREQRRAADITALGDGGFRASGLLPRSLDRYAIYGAMVVSPCDGEATDVRDGLPDLVPPTADPENPAGSHVTIACGGITIVLAHLKQGSVRVRPGDRVATGDDLSLAGNSGNTTEPHLHIHGFDPETGEGVTLSFDGRTPVRNRIFER